MTATDPNRGPTSEIGHQLGFVSIQGQPYDVSEFTAELSWPLSIAVYDRMRRQDAQIKSVLNAVTLPIIRAEWRVDANGAPPDVVKLIADDLGLPIKGDKAPARRPRDRQRFSFGEHVRLALLSLVYGHMPFEKVGAIMDDGLWHLTKLGERMPPTIARIHVTRGGDLEKIDQYPSGSVGDYGPFDEIPADSLVFYSHDREGGLWQGQSLLRSAYKNWLLKDRLIRVDAMKHERNGLGVPQVEAPPNASEHMMSQLNDIASKFRVSESAGLALPAGARLRLVGVEGNLPDTLASIAYHDQQMAREALAQFLDLVTSSHGSRALSTSLIDFFVMSMQSVAEEVASTFNEQMIEPWVDWNWGEDVPAPRLDPGEIGADTSLTAESLTALVTCGALEADAALDAWLRQQYHLPEREGPENPPPPQQETVPPPPGQPVPADKPAVAAGRRHPFHAASAGNTDLAPSWPGRAFLKKLTAHYAPQIADGLASLADPAALARAVIEHGFTPHEATHQITADNDALRDLVRLAYGDAYLAGYHCGDEMVKKAGATPARVTWASRVVRAAGEDLEGGDETIDWSAWEPGYPEAAALTAASDDQSTGLAQLLADADVTIRGLEGTTIDRLGNALTVALEQGYSVSQAADLLRGVLDDSSRAELIAQTEMARAMTVATLDSYAENRVPGRQWLLSDGACPLCEENEEAGVVMLADDFPNGDPPVHPSCVCAVEPVIDGG